MCSAENYENLILVLHSHVKKSPFYTLLKSHLLDQKSVSGPESGWTTVRSPRTSDGADELSVWFTRHATHSAFFWRFFWPSTFSIRSTVKRGLSVGGQKSAENHNALQVVWIRLYRAAWFMQLDSCIIYAWKVCWQIAISILVLSRNITDCTDVTWFTVWNWKIICSWKYMKN